MGAQDRRRIFAVAAAAGFKELIVLGASLTADFGCGIIGTNITVNVCMELFDELGQEIIIGFFIDGKMEFKIEILKLVDVGLALCFLEYLRCPLNSPVGDKGNSCTDSAHLKDNTGVHGILKLVTGELGYDRAPVGVNADKTLCMELTKSLPYGDMADAQLSGNLILTEGHTTGEHASDDRGTEDLINPVPCRHRMLLHSTCNVFKLHKNTLFLRFSFVYRSSAYITKHIINLYYIIVKKLFRNFLEIFKKIGKNR